MSNNDTTTKTITSFFTGGTLQPNDPTYIIRPAVQNLFEACLKGQFAFIFASRQIGKSSLVVGVMQQLEKNNINTVLIDLTKIGTLKTLDDWYINIIDPIVGALKLNVNVDDWWQQPSRLSANQRFNKFLETHILPNISKNMVIFLDEIDTMLKLDFTDEVMANIRALYNTRATNEVFQKLTFVLIGVATPNELINDPKTTPFNIGQQIELVDFSKSQLEPYRIALVNQHPQHGNQYFEDIFSWTDGHPYLTQKLCSLVFNVSNSSDLDLVTQIVQENFIDQQTDYNISYVRDSLVRHELVEEMLEVYQSVVEGNTVRDDIKSPIYNRLKLTGLVVAENGILKIRNKLYATIFDTEWVKITFEKLPVLGIPSYYDIIDTLHENSLTTIYWAKNLRTKQDVALKVLKVKIIEPVQQQRVIEHFKKEIETIRQFNHPNIIEIYEVTEGRTSYLRKQQLFLAMRFISGGTLADKLPETKTWRRSRILRLIQEIGSALAAVHAKGIVHRDVKPHNILLEPEPDGSLKAILTDFGIAMLGNTPNHDSQGTFKYAAPEQYQSGQPITTAADIYALGLIAYELLAGQYTPAPLPKFQKDDYKIFYDVLSKATTSNPAERYQTASEFITALITPFVQSEMEKAKFVKSYPEAALQILEEVLLVAPELDEAVTLKSQMLDQKGEGEAALQTLENAHQRGGDTNNIWHPLMLAWDKKATDLWLQQKYSDALDYYVKVAQLAAAHVPLLTPQLQQIQNQAREQQIEYYLKGLGETPSENFEANLQSFDHRITKLNELGAEEAVSQVQEAKRLRQLDYHYQLGLKIYAEGQPENLAEAIEKLEHQIGQVKNYQGGREVADLQEKWVELGNQQDYQQGLKIFADKSLSPQESIERVKLLLRELDNHGGQAQAQVLRDKLIEVARQAINDNPDDEVVFYFYREIDKTYLKLKDEPSLHENLKANVQQRQRLSEAARAKGDYLTALSHLTKIRAYTVYQQYGDKITPTPKQLDENIERLRLQQTHYENYREIQKARDEKDYQRAFNLLMEKFIQPGIYTIPQDDNLLSLARFLFEAKKGSITLFYEKLEEELQNETKKVNQLRGEVKTKTAQITKLESDNIANINKIDRLQGEVRVKTEEAKKSQSEATARANQIKQLQGEVATKAKLIEQWQGEVATKTKLIEQLQGEVATKVKLIEQLRGEVTAKETQLQTANRIAFVFPIIAVIIIMLIVGLLGL